VAVPAEAMAKASPGGDPPPSYSLNGYFGGTNYMTSVKDQGANCGSCWDFAAIGAMEAQYQINRGNPSTGIDLSEQDALSCSGGDCGGWWLDLILDYLKNSGVPDDACSSYVDGNLASGKTPCPTYHCSNYAARKYYITGWSWISTDAATIKNYIYTYRHPVIVWMPIFNDFPWYDANYWQNYFYSHVATWQEPPYRGGHFVVIVGWDDQGAGTDDDYWIVRNSWGTSGGDVNDGYGGYFYMTQNSANGFFGMQTQAAVIADVVPASTILNKDLIIARLTSWGYLWFIHYPSGTFWTRYWGVSGDTPIVSGADMDGDGLEDIVAWRPSDGRWYILQSKGNYMQSFSRQWGAAGDVPLVADFDRDGISDLVIWRPSVGAWFILRSSGGSATIYWGMQGDTPLIGDRDGDGIPDLIIWRPSVGVWFVLKSSSGYTSWDTYQWGIAGDVPLLDHFDGDGKVDLVIWRPSVGAWFILKSLGGFSVHQWGTSGDVPLLAHVDPSVYGGFADLIIWRPSSGTWFVLRSYTGYDPSSPMVVSWGTSGDVPLTAKGYWSI